MRILAPITLTAAMALTACAPPPYEQATQPSVGFGDYAQYAKDREANLAGQPQPAGPGPVNAYGASLAPSGAPLSAGTMGTTDPNAAPTMGDLAAAGIAPAEAVGANLGATATGQPLTATGQPLTGTTVTATEAATATPLPAEAAAAADNGAISDEQDFSAVAQRQSIESDKQRIEANKAQYQQIQPGALPQRSGDAASPVIAYAIGAKNRLGEQAYKRSGLSVSSSEKACLRYASTTEAQAAFLKSGGPKRDPKNLDPDGDGFACSFDPTPFQNGAATPAPAPAPAPAAGGNG